MENILQKSKALEDYLVRIRRHLHKYPELSMEEKETIKFVTRELQGMGIPYEIVPDGGIIGTIEGKKKGKTLILRADLDALPMQEAEVNLHTKKPSFHKWTGSPTLVVTMPIQQSYSV